VVKVIRVNAEGEGDAARTTPVTEVCAALARHGVKCEAMEAAADHSHVGHTLLARAEDEGCDLLVMGCYGHSRLREFVLGGASRHVLAHMTMPVLMSH
jgi:nucleotide-binding universal stress UspA family protein